MRGYLIVLAVTMLVTLLTTPLVRLVAVRVGAVVPVDPRKVHTRPMPVLGGAAMYLGFLAGMVAATQLDQFDPVFASGSEALGVLLGASVIFAVGLLDDVRDVSAPAKLMGMVLAGSVLSLFGVTMLFLRVPFAGNIALSPDLAPLVTVLWVVGMANAVNLIDGLDGLAAGIVAIAAGAFALYSSELFERGLLPNSNTISPLVAVIALGVCLGFLAFNFHPARLIMGDAGALFLGLLMACSTLLVGGQTAQDSSGSTYFFFAPLFIPFFILGVPIFDSAFAIVRRASRGTGWATADKDHLHHRLMRLGHGHRRTVLILWAWTAILSGLVLVPVYTDRGNAIAPFVAAALGVALYTLLHPEVRRARAAQQLELDLGLDDPEGTQADDLV